MTKGGPHPTNMERTSFFFFFFFFFLNKKWGKEKKGNNIEETAVVNLLFLIGSKQKDTRGEMIETAMERSRQATRNV